MLLLDDIKSQKVPAAALKAQKLLITGPVGVGKSTVAEALAARWMGVEGWMKGAASTQVINHGTSAASTFDLADAFPFDFVIIDGGVDGIDKVKEVAAASMQAPSDPRCRARAFLIEEIHAMASEKAIQALLLPIAKDTRNLWIACTSRPKSQLDRGILSRLSYHLDFGAADVEAVLISNGTSASDAAAVARRAQGDMRLALGSGDDGGGLDSAALIHRTPNGYRLAVDARRLLSLAVARPFAVQAALLDAVVDSRDVHSTLCLTLSHRNDIAAHQLLDACRRAGLV